MVLSHTSPSIKTSINPISSPFKIHTENIYTYAKILSLLAIFSATILVKDSIISYVFYCKNITKLQFLPLFSFNLFLTKKPDWSFVAFISPRIKGLSSLTWTGLPYSLWFKSPTSLSLIQLQQYWSPCRSSYTSDMLPSLDL